MKRTEISHYRVLEKIGEGGMGEVYKAEDTKLKRIVALKFLTLEVSEEAGDTSRFVREAQAAASLDHPNICTIYEIDEVDGDVFIAMAYVEGETLVGKVEQGPMDLDAAIDIAMQIAEGLREAHENGVIHRDVKPGNIVVTPQGRVKIMDFGLAKLASECTLAEQDMASGTLAYMSPEQVSGGETDARADIWSLGATLYEMVTGRRPFAGAYEQAVVYSILNEEAEAPSTLRPDIPKELEKIIMKALSKDPSQRYGTAEGILQDLKRVHTRIVPADADKAPADTTASIAVLPFTDMSPEQDQEYFCDGIAEELISGLAKLTGLRVASRTSAFRFRGEARDVREIGEKLNVSALLEGSVRKAGNRLRITAQLINVADGYHIWSEKFDRDLEDVFAIQDEISIAIVNNLKLKLLGEEKEKLVRKGTDDLEAYNLYLKGRYFWNKRTIEDVWKSVDYFKQAIDRDPDFALACVGIADAYVVLVDYGVVTAQEYYPMARKAASRALELNDGLAGAHTTMGMIKANFDWDFDAAVAEFKTAIELEPDYPTAHQWLGLQLGFQGLLDEGIKELEIAKDLDPLSVIMSTGLGVLHFFAGHYDEAEAELKNAMELNPELDQVHLFLGLTYAEKSEYDLAVEEIEGAISGGSDHITRSVPAITLHRMGREDRRREVLEQLIEESKSRYVSPVPIAFLYFSLGEKDEGFKWLELAIEQRDHELWSLKVAPWVEGVRDDPRFKEILKTRGFS